MSRSVGLGRLFGINIRLHFSWIVIFVLVAWSLTNSFLPNNYPDWTQGVYLLVGVLGSALLFVSVLIHELSHSLLAISRGHKVQGITLFFLGGISEIEEEAHDPGEEFWISVVGPLSSFALSALFWVLLEVSRSTSIQVQALFTYLIFVNLVLGVFNLIPALPLDGGRVLRSIVWRVTGNLTQATTVSSVAGTLLGVILIICGIYFSFTVSFVTGLWLIFVGWFIQSAASSVRRQQVMKTVLSGKLASDAMHKEYSTIPPTITAQAVLLEHGLKDQKRGYVVMLGDTFLGIVSVSDIKLIPPEERDEKYVTEVMTRPPNILSVHPSDSLEEILKLFSSKDINKSAVMDNDKLVGLLTRKDILRVLKSK